MKKVSSIRLSVLYEIFLYHILLRIMVVEKKMLYVYTN